MQQQLSVNVKRDLTKHKKNEMWSLLKQKDMPLARKLRYQSTTSAQLLDVLQTNQSRVNRINAPRTNGLARLSHLFSQKKPMISPESHFTRTLFNNEPKWFKSEDSFMPLKQLFDLGAGEEGYLSVFLENILYSTSITKYPLDFNYYDERDQYVARKSTSPAGLKNYIDACKNQKSDMLDEYVYGFQVTLNSGGWAPRKAPTVHSKRGQGNDLELCNVIDNEFIYCPPSGKCLLYCIHRAFPEEYTKYFTECLLSIKKGFNPPLNYNYFARTMK
jgi:hypothetical protein